MIAFFEITQCLQKCCVSYSVSVTDKTDKSNYPEYRPQKRIVAGFWKADFHLDMTFSEISEKVDLLIRTASDQRLGNIGSHIAVFQNLYDEILAVMCVIMDLRIYGIRKSEIFSAGFQNDLIQMADPGFAAPFMNLVEINF